MKQKVTLIADEGKILTDGKHYARVAYLIPGDDGGAWHEIPEEEYNAKMAEMAAQEAVTQGGGVNA